MTGNNSIRCARLAAPGVESTLGEVGSNVDLGLQGTSTVDVLWVRRLMFGNGKLQHGRVRI